ncbi:MAG: hypothetical protein NTY38_32130 [Acidobacteria bacterium]|nr:hypothetical protein [Acidobacteriota bacterium]
MRSVALLLLLSLPAAAATGLRVRDHRVELLAGSEVAARSASEGLWSIACDWRDAWPTAWQHAAPTRMEQDGDWTILHGELEACGGPWRLTDSYRPENGLIRVTRRYEYKGAATASRVTLGVRFETASPGRSILLPGILYYGNPSGARSGKVPVWNGTPGEEALFEEHRYPMPFAYLETRTPSGLLGFALHSRPSPLGYANLPDQWWSLGAIATTRGAEAVLYSGPAAMNGQRSRIKAYQDKLAPYDNAWLNVAPGAIIEKTFYLEAFPVATAGSGFRQPVRSSLQLFSPFDPTGLPTFAEIIRAKYRYAQARWLERGSAAGYRKYPDRDTLVLGWCGQDEALGYALQILAPHLNDPQALPHAQASLDFLSGAAFYQEGFHTWYDIPKAQWHGEEILSQGQAMLAIIRAIRAARRTRLNSSRWESFFRKAAGFHAARILRADWHPLSTSEAAFIAPLVLGFQLFHESAWRQAALKAAEHYAARHLPMREPYWGGTLDASSEDKEGAAMAFQGFLALYEFTGDPRHLAWARHACDAMLTYTVVWDIDLPPGRLRDHAFRTRGWTSVSPQNQHLDVWGTVVAPDIYRLGEIDHREDLKRLAIVMYRTCGQLIDAHGGQGEQMEQTNYTQRRGDPAVIRGGYNESWTVFWITAHFLTGAARFAELGLPLWESQ